MPVAFGSIVNATPATGTGATSPSITTPASSPVMVVGIGLVHASATVWSVTPNTFGGTASEVANLRDIGNNAYTSIWAITAPTPSTAGTVTCVLSVSVPYQMVVAGYSGADQTTPCPVADAIEVVAGSGTLTPANLTADDATVLMATNGVFQDLTPATPNNRFLNNTTACNDAVRDNTGTTGVTFGTTDAGGVAVVA